MDLAALLVEEVFSTEKLQGWLPVSAMHDSYQNG